MLRKMGVLTLCDVPTDLTAGNIDWMLARVHTLDGTAAC
jgi:hypothetical protein